MQGGDDSVVPAPVGHIITAEDGEPTLVIHTGETPEEKLLPRATRPMPPFIPHHPTAPAAPISEALAPAIEKLHSVFRMKELRPGQAEIIESVLAGRDTLAVMPTGSGKSLTYQLPALVLPGPTLVVSPLLALIEDQTNKLKAAGVPVARIDSTRTAKERAADLQAVIDGTIKLILITPESINSPAVQDTLAKVKFSLFCVDEAHCVSQWGHDFRPSYLGLRRAAEVLGRPPILGLTATATPAIAEDVLVQLGMRDPKICRVSFHRPNLAFDVRKVAGEADKLRVLGKLIQRLRRPGIVYCATVRAVDDLYVALRHGKIPVERYNGKMTTEEREAAQAAFMTTGRKVVMLATNAFGLGIDKADIRYIIHYQMPGSPEAYIQEAGRAGRDGKPARCVLLFQPDDISIQEHFLKEAHPTKTQARLAAEGLYAWSDEGKEVSVRDLALSLALPERRVRVILSVLEGMGVAHEVATGKWKGVEPRPTREQIDKAASVFEARRISDRRRLASLLKYMNTQRCRVQMMREYFGEPEGEPCGLCDSCAGLDSEVFDPGDEDHRTGLHAATDFHGRQRRRRRDRHEKKPGQPQQQQQQQQPEKPALPPAPVFETAIPELLPELPPFEVGPAPESESFIDETIWAQADGAGTPLDGDVVIDDEIGAWLAEQHAIAAADGHGAVASPAEALAEGNGEPAEGNAVPAEMVVEGNGEPADGNAAPAAAVAEGNGEPAPAEMVAEGNGAPTEGNGAPAEGNGAPAIAEDDWEARWAAVRDAAIRPFVEWREVGPVSLPVMSTPAPGRQQQHQQQQQHHRHQQQNQRHHQHGRHSDRRRAQQEARAERRNRRRDRRNNRRNDRDRGPRLPGFYNPGDD